MKEKDYPQQSKKIGLSNYDMFGPKVKQFIDFSKSPEMLDFIEKLQVLKIFNLIQDYMVEVFIELQQEDV
jgi:hypothetical protein